MEDGRKSKKFAVRKEDVLSDDDDWTQKRGEKRPKIKKFIDERKRERYSRKRNMVQENGRNCRRRARVLKKSFDGF